MKSTPPFHRMIVIGTVNVPILGHFGTQSFPTAKFNGSNGSNQNCWCGSPLDAGPWWVNANFSGDVAGPQVIPVMPGDSNPEKQIPELLGTPKYWPQMQMKVLNKLNQKIIVHAQFSEKKLWQETPNSALLRFQRERWTVPKIISGSKLAGQEWPYSSQSMVFIQRWPLEEGMPGYG